MSAQMITYWNSNMKHSRKLSREDANVTVRTFRCGCQVISEHSNLAQRREHESCGRHHKAPNCRPVRIERFV